MFVTKLKERTLGSKNGRTDSVPTLVPSTEEMQKAEVIIFKSCQRAKIAEEVQVLENLGANNAVLDRDADQIRKKRLRKISSLYGLNPILDKNGLIRVGGRTSRANISMEIMHPIVLPRKSHTTEMIINDCHLKVKHMGRGKTLNEIRQAGYWIIGGSSAVSQAIHKCVTCKILRGTPMQQKMSDLPRERVSHSPPFSYCGADFFGPFYIKDRRSEVKRYGVLFTCMTSRTIHLETTNSLSTSSFLIALTRFTARRGAVRQIRCDRGTNFIGASNELKKSLKDLDQEKMKKILVDQSCDWIPFLFNTPCSSHMGGVWKRQIQTVKRVLSSIIRDHGAQLGDETFCTVLTEVENIVNSRPLTVEGINDSSSQEPLTPNHLLTMKPRVVLPPPGIFQREDVYAKKWWRRAQYVADQFWLRWRLEYLNLLQKRTKWVNPERSLKAGDILIKDEDIQRKKWPLGRVEEVVKSADGKVRRAKSSWEILTNKDIARVKQACSKDLCTNWFSYFMKSENVEGKRSNPRQGLFKIFT